MLYIFPGLALFLLLRSVLRFVLSLFILDVRTAGYVTKICRNKLKRSKTALFLEEIFVLFKNLQKNFCCRTFLVIGFKQGSSLGMGENVKDVKLEFWVKEKE